MQMNEKLMELKKCKDSDSYLFFFEKLLEAPFGVHCVFLLTTTATVFLWGPKLGAWSELAMIEISLGFKACHLISKLVF